MKIFFCLFTACLLLGLVSCTGNGENNETKVKKTAGEMLEDTAWLPEVEGLPKVAELPDPFTFWDGRTVKAKEDWYERAEEIRSLYQYYMYGIMPEKTGETVSYSLHGGELKINVARDGKETSFSTIVWLPQAGQAPAEGYPVLIVFGGLLQVNYVNERGYAVIAFNPQVIAADNLSRTGAFYELYPYGTDWREQTGVLMAWAWGVSKIIDALEAGAAADLNINPGHTIVAGVSRWGKAAAVAGAFDRRIKVTVPVCSGAAGMASFRYVSEGKVYDYSSLGMSDPYVMTANEPLGSLQSSMERHWFNDNFVKFREVEALPFDQHLLAALCAEEGRYLFIIGSYLHEDWTNPPGMWVTYLAAREVFQFLGYEEQIAIHLHPQGHMVTNEDLVYLLDYCDHHFYGKTVTGDLGKLKQSIYLEPANYDPFFDRYLKD